MILDIKCEINEHGYNVINEKFGDWGIGYSKQDALIDFFESLMMNYQAYAMDDPNNLDENAKKLAQEYRELFDF
jgi:hypothetical protein